MTEAELDALILSMPEATQSSHFDAADFRVRGRIFATRPGPGKLTLKLTPAQQEMLCTTEGDVFARVPNKWGDKGWTSARVDALDEETARSVLTMAWSNVAPRAPSIGR